MNLAFSTLLIAAIAAPGGLFFEAYRRGLSNRPYEPTSLPATTFLYLLFSIPVHLISSGLAELLIRGGAYGLFRLGLRHTSAVATSLESSIRPKGRFLLALVVGRGNSTKALYDLSYNWASTHLELLLAYFMFAGAVGFGLGLLAQWVVRRLRWDVKLRILRMQPDIWYLFSADYTTLLKRNFVPKNLLPKSRWRDPADSVLVAAAVEVGNEAYILWGLLVDYETDRGDEIKRLMLSNVVRRTLGEDRDLDNEPPKLFPPANDKRFYPIQGDVLVVDYKYVLNMNVRYVYASVKRHKPTQLQVVTTA